MNAENHSVPLNEFMSRIDEHVARLRQSGKAEFLTAEDGSAIVVQDADAYERMFDAIEAIETIEAVSSSIRQFERGEGLEARAALESLRKKYDIPHRTQS